MTAEAAQRMLKDLMFNIWSNNACEEPADIVKLLSLIDFYLPFFPLERDHIRSLFTLKLEKKRQELLADGSDLLNWNADVIDFLVSKVHLKCPHRPSKFVGFSFPCNQGSALP